MKRLVAFLVTVGLASAFVWFLTSPVAERLVESRVTSELEKREIPMRVVGLDLNWSDTSIDEICVVEGSGEGAVSPACVHGVVMDSPFFGRLPLIKVGRIDVESVEIDVSTSERVAALEEAVDAFRNIGSGRVDRARPAADSSSGTASEGVDNDLPTIAFRTISATLPGEPDPRRVAVRNLEIVAPPPDAVAMIRFDPDLDDAGLDDAVLGAIPESVQVVVSRDGDTWKAEILDDGGGSLRANLGDDLEVSVQSVTVGTDRTIAVSLLDVAWPHAPGARFQAARIELELRDLTTDLADLYFARADFDAPRFQLDVGEGTVLDALEQLTGGRATEEGDGSGDGQALGAEDTTGEGASDPWADRRWWERIPQQIDVEDGVVTVNFVFEVDPPVPAIAEIRDIDFEYALRAIRTQLDVELSAELLMSGNPAGSFSLSGVWDWVDETLKLDANLDRFEVGFVTSLSGATRAAAPRGLAWLTVSYEDRADGSIPNLSGSATAQMLDLDVDALQERPMFDRLEWTWRANRESADEPLVFHEGAGAVGNTDFVLTPTITGFDYENPYLGDHIDVHLDIPSQPAIDVLYSIPRTIMGSLYATELTGDWGLTLDFPLTWGDPDPETGRRALDIGQSSSFEVRDQDLRLLSLPEELDVRRLNGPMTFTFAGPDGTTAREIAIPAPRAPVEQVDVAAIPTEAPEGWARLEDISYFLIATTLYREDGRFFRNRGINWFQWRAVLEQAWADGHLGRGASTISMQLVKNVFLTHERSVERKVRELFLTYWLNRLVPKERILEVYLNVIEWGPGINGVVEASEYYFGKPPGRLTVAEAVWLSSILPAPVRRGRQREAGQAPEWAVRHCHDLLQGMAARGWITQSELAKGLNGRIRFATPGSPDPSTVGPAPWDRDGGTPFVMPPAVDAPDPTVTSPIGIRLADQPQARIRSLIESQLELRP